MDDKDDRWNMGWRGTWEWWVCGWWVEYDENVDGEYDKEYVEDEYKYDEEDDQENLWIFGLKDLLLACIFILGVHNLQK